MEENKTNVDEKFTEEVKEETKTEDVKKEPTKKEKKEKINKEIEALKGEVEKYKALADEWKDKYYRVYADMDNQRKQYSKEYQQAVKYQSQNLAEKLIPSFEMFSMVVNNTGNVSPEVQAYIAGFDMVYRQMVQALESENIKEITAKIGDAFDHKIHYAIEAEEVDDEKQVDKVIKIVRKGYMIHDRLIKPVTVVVGKKKEVKEDKKEEAKA